LLWFFLACIYLALVFTLCIKTFKKGYTVLGIIGIFFPILWVVGAFLPAKPGSSADIQKGFQH
jgi:hypothetical protein